MFFKEFYSCPNCGHAICGEKRKYFVCPHCGSEVCKAEDLPELNQNYCGHCGQELASAKKEALALAEVEESS